MRRPPADGASQETVLDGPTFAPIVADDSYYELDREPPQPGSCEHGTARRVLTVTVKKLTPTKAKGHWPCVVKGEPQIDVEAFGNRVIAINENSKDDVREYLNIMEGANTGVLPEE